MKKYVLVLMLALLFTTSFAQSKITTLPSQQEENTSVEIEEKDNIREATFRYLFNHNDSALQKKASTYFISIEGKAPSKEFLERFNDYKPSVKSKTEAVYKEGGSYWVFDINGKPSLVFQVRVTKWIDGKTVEIDTSYYDWSFVQFKTS